MTLKDQCTRAALNLTLLVFVLAPLFFNPDSAPAMGNAESTLPNFPDFVKQVQNGEANALRGVYVTFQTCIKANGNWNWGRLFVMAMPIP